MLQCNEQRVEERMFTTLMATDESVCIELLADSRYHGLLRVSIYILSFERLVRHTKPSGQWYVQEPHG